MNDGIILAGGVLTVAAAVVLTLRRRQERSILQDWASGHGWSIDVGPVDRMMPRLSRLALMQIGYRRRILSIVHDPNDVHVFEFTCETGLDHDRQSHRWIVVAVPLGGPALRATISSEPWVIAAAMRPAYRRLAIGTNGTNAERNGVPIAVVEDEIAWSRLLEGEVGARLRRQPSARSWEVLPDLLVGYQPAPVSVELVGELVSAGKELAKLLGGVLGKMSINEAAVG